MSHQFENNDGKMKITENYSWGYKNQLYILKYEFQTSVLEEG